LPSRFEIPIALQEMHEGVGGGHFSSETIIQNLFDVNNAQGCFPILLSL
jgi:hypothetical protein